MSVSKDLFSFKDLSLFISPLKSEEFEGFSELSLYQEHQLNVGKKSSPEIFLFERFFSSQSATVMTKLPLLPCRPKTWISRSNFSKCLPGVKVSSQSLSHIQEKGDFDVQDQLPSNQPGDSHKDKMNALCVLHASLGQKLTFERFFSNLKDFCQKCTNYVSCDFAIALAKMSK